MSEIRSSTEQARAAALKLADECKAIDEELETQVQVLRDQQVGMTSPLIDSEGFPLAQPDLLAVRTARARIIALRNDREELEGLMRQLLEQALAKDTAPSSSSESATFKPGAATRKGDIDKQIGAEERDPEGWDAIEKLQPFANVNSVASGGPAEVAGLQMGDQILRFAHLTFETADGIDSDSKLGALPSVVRNGEAIEVLLLRQGLPQRLRLTPRLGWGGRGLLGCHLTPT